MPTTDNPTHKIKIGLEYEGERWTASTLPDSRGSVVFRRLLATGAGSAEMTWTAPTDAASLLAWTLRHTDNALTSEDRQFLASLINSYIEILHLEQEPQHAIAETLRQVIDLEAGN